MAAPTTIVLIFHLDVFVRPVEIPHTKSLTQAEFGVEYREVEPSLIPFPKERACAKSWPDQAKLVVVSTQTTDHEAVPLPALSVLLLASGSREGPRSGPWVGPGSGGWVGLGLGFCVGPG